MDKKGVKNILISMRTSENENIVNMLLGKIDLMNEISIQNAVEQVGGNEEKVRALFEQKIQEKQRRHHSDEHIPINEMFSYGVTGNCVHLHLPIDLHPLIKQNGISKTIALVNLNLLDAIDKVTNLKQEGFYKFQDKDNIFMISPILRGNELRFLSNLDFDTTIYKKQELSNEEFVDNNSGAKLAIQIFGNDKNVGTARIKFDTILSKEWQEKKNNLIKEFAEKGIVLHDDKSK